MTTADDGACLRRDEHGIGALAARRSSSTRRRCATWWRSRSALVGCTGSTTPRRSTGRYITFGAGSAWRTGRGRPSSDVPVTSSRPSATSAAAARSPTTSPPGSAPPMADPRAHVRARRRTSRCDGRRSTQARSRRVVGGQSSRPPILTLESHGSVELAALQRCRIAVLRSALEATIVGTVIDVSVAWDRTASWSVGELTAWWSSTPSGRRPGPTPGLISRSRNARRQHVVDRRPVVLRCRGRSRAARRRGGPRSSGPCVDIRMPASPAARGSGEHSRPAPGRRPRPRAAGATASIRNSPSSSRAISRHGEPAGQKVTVPSSSSLLDGDPDLGLAARRAVSRAVAVRRRRRVDEAVADVGRRR